MGGAVADCDQVYHELLRACVPMRDELCARFGGSIFDGHGDLRRRELGAIVALGSSLGNEHFQLGDDVPVGDGVEVAQRHALPHSAPGRAGPGRN